MRAVAALIPEKPCQGALISDVEIRNRSPEKTENCRDCFKVYECMPDTNDALITLSKHMESTEFDRRENSHLVLETIEASREPTDANYHPTSGIRDKHRK
ncbi:hypothetical protein D5086_022144 [Populus alba]|uniref:Uncharacterized protein n=1 Tax=Populus alba TaxID=43335 RepID=A0ACC4BF27_POPAL